MTSKYIFILVIIITATFYVQCSEDSSDNNNDSGLSQKASTYDIIQQEIFNKNCVTCHQEGTSFAKQSNLILSKGQSYKQLVNRLPNNPSAKADDLILVGTKGLQSIYESFLWEKINILDYTHFYEDHPEYGELMPLGGQSLTTGELHFIYEWILAGAPDTGNVAGITLLDDKERFVIPSEEFVRLPKPSKGFQLNIGPFDILPQREREFFYYQPLENDREIFVDKIEITMREGSHHFILYDYPEGDIPPKGIFRDYYNNNGNFNFNTAISILNQRYVFGTQWRNLDYSFPPGVALKIPKGAEFDLNSHYVNHTDEVKLGEVSVNLHTVEESDVQFVAENLFENYLDIELPPGKITTLERTSIFQEKMNVFQLTSHAHKHMTEFEIYIVGGMRDGELVYFANDWEHPPLISFDPPIVLEKGHGLKAVATYDNDTNRTLRFGLRSEDEMMILFGAFYTEL